MIKEALIIAAILILIVIIMIVSLVKGYINSMPLVLGIAWIPGILGLYFLNIGLRCQCTDLY